MKSICFFLMPILLLPGLTSLYSQDLKYTRQVIDTLCSNEMSGRGYVKKGEQYAAHFIASEFKRAGLKKYAEAYFQNFTIPVNTFPGKMKVNIDGYDLKPAEDFLIDPGSSGISGTYAVVRLSIEDILNDTIRLMKLKKASGKFIVVDAYDKKMFSKGQNNRIQDIVNDLLHAEDHLAEGTIILTNDKLTWSVDTRFYSKPSLIIKSTSIKQPITKIQLDIENKFVKNYKTQNVLGFLEGDRSDSLLVYTAHYDHLGMMGRDAIFQGANDNASGVAMLLNLVRYYTQHKPKYTTVFIAFGAEEIGLLGSTYFVEHPLFPLSKIKFLLNFDMAGTGDEGIQIVNGKVYKQKFDLITQINTEFNFVKQVKIRGEACNSDHCLLYSKGVPCFFIYTLGGIQAYHDIYDKAITLPLTDFEDYFKLIVEFIKRI